MNFDNYGGGAVPPTSAWDDRYDERERRQRKLKRRAVSSVRNSFMVGSAGTTCAATSIYSVSTFAEGAFTLKEIVFSVVLFTIFFLGMYFLLRFGVDELPHMKRAKREKTLPVYCLAACVAFILSAATSVLGITGDPLRDHHLNEVVVETAEYAVETEAEVKEVFALDSTVESKERELVASDHGETTGGTHCGTGQAGSGRCATLLKGLVITTDNGLKEMRRKDAAAAPVMARLQNEVEAMRRLARDNDVKYAEKAARLRTHISQIEFMVNELRQLAPVETLRRIASDWSRDYGPAGMTAQGQDRLDTMLSDAARVLVTVAQDADHQFSKSAPELDNVNTLELVGRYADSHWVLIVMSIFPDLLALSILIITYISTDKDGDDDLDPDSGHGFGSGSGGLRDGVTPYRPVSRAQRQDHHASPHQGKRPDFHTLH